MRLGLKRVGEGRGIPRFRLLNELCHEGETALRRVAAAFEPGTSVEVIVRVGRPAEVILEAARHWRADAIILSRRERSAWLNWFRRHTVARVTREAPCQVWLAAQKDRSAPLNLMVLARPGANRCPEARAFHLTATRA